MAEEEGNTQPKNGDELRGKSHRGRQKPHPDQNAAAEATTLGQERRGRIGAGSVGEEGGRRSGGEGWGRWDFSEKTLVRGFVGGWCLSKVNTRCCVLIISHACLYS